MPRYAAFLRGVSPMNAKMPELKSAFEAAGFTDVKTVRSSGNVVFSSNRTSESALQRKAEAAMLKRLDHQFLTIVRLMHRLIGWDLSGSMTRREHGRQRSAKSENVGHDCLTVRKVAV